MHTPPNARRIKKSYCGQLSLTVNIALIQKHNSANDIPTANLDLSIQFSDALDTETRALLKPIFSKKNALKWLGWAIDPQAPHLEEVTLRIVDKAEGLSVNKQFRGRAYATNILTFNESQILNTQADLLICAPVIIAEAKELGVSLREHCAHLLVHGALHAQGYDHEAGPEQELQMETLESLLMMSLGFEDPYWDH